MCFDVPLPPKIKYISSLPSEILNILHHTFLLANCFTPSTSESLHTHTFLFSSPILRGFLFRLLFILFVLSAAGRKPLSLFMYLGTIASSDKATCTTTNQREVPRCSICRNKQQGRVCASCQRRSNDSNPEAGCLSRLTSTNITLKYLFIPETRLPSPAIYELVCIMPNSNITTDTAARCSKFAAQICLRHLKNGTIGKLKHEVGMRCGLKNGAI